MLLLTNDDGIDAPGLEALKAAVEGLNRPVVVVAPDGPRSGCGHAVTTHQPVRAVAVGSDRYAVSGTPADCVRLGLDRLAPGASWVLSGINAGGNLGTDLLHSGTAAAAREAALRGRPGIAVSHYIRKGQPLDWPRAARWTRQVIDQLLHEPPPPAHFWNVNLPHPDANEPDPLIEFCPVDPSPLISLFRWVDDLAHYEAVYADRPRIDNADVFHCFAGRITISLVPALGSSVDPDRLK